MLFEIKSSITLQSLSSFLLKTHKPSVSRVESQALCFPGVKNTNVPKELKQ